MQEDQAAVAAHSRLTRLLTSKLKFDAVCGLDSNPSLLLESIAGLITVTSSPAGLLYYYIKEAQMVLSDWCYPSVDSSWLLNKQGNMFTMLQDHIKKGYNFVVVTGNPRVGALGGCKDALDHVLD
ncbi:hypothetical protein WJX82_001146 [Trebouxia sp. C0006]